MHPAFRAVFLVGADLLLGLLAIDLALAHHTTEFNCVMLPVAAIAAAAVLGAHRYCRAFAGSRSLANVALVVLILLAGAFVLSYVPTTRSALAVAALAAYFTTARMCSPSASGARALLAVASILVTVQSSELVLGVVSRERRPPSEPMMDWGDLLAPLSEMRRGGRLRPGLDVTTKGPYSVRGVHTITNRDGFRNARELSEVPAPGVIRVLVLGDSFVGGYRTAQQDLWSEQLAASLDSALREQARSVELATAVVNDPAEAWYHYARFAPTLRPHLVVLAVTLGNDFTQTYVNLHAGGLLRATGDAQSITLNPSPDIAGLYAALGTRLPPSAWWPRSWRTWLRERMHHLGVVLRSGRIGAALGECAVALGLSPAGEAINCSYSDGLPRSMDLLQGLGFFLVDAPPVVEEAYSLTRVALVALKTLCDRDQVPLALIVFPQRFQVHPQDWWATTARYRLAEEAFDLDRPNRFLRDLARELGVPCCDVTLSLQRSAAAERRNYYLPHGDMHWNVRGHRAVARAMEDFFLDLVRQLTAREMAR
ncbi:MAG: SGNH/GDSL hydrolase family protein [Planctomycetota bacterium]